MSKFISSILVLVMVLALAPASFAARYGAPERALKIKSATLETDRQRVIGQLTVCNNEAADTSFVIDVKNETINSLYQRKLAIDGGACETYKLDFTTNFAEMSNTGDEVRFVAKSIRDLNVFGHEQLSAPYVAIVKEGNRDVEPCGDTRGGDKIYSVCVNDFIYHEKSDVRVKVKSIDHQRVDLLVTHVRWGGVKAVRVYKGRSKEVVSRNEDRTKIEISNLIGENPGAFLLEIDSL